MYVTSDINAMDVLTVLRAIANRAGSPTITYSPENEREEQRESLNWIAKQAAEAIQIMLDKGAL